MRNIRNVFIGLLMAAVFILSPLSVMADGEGGLKAEGDFVVGMEVNYAPFNWSQTDDKNGAVPVANSPGEYANGYDVWMAKTLAEGMGKNLVIQKIEWDGLPPALTSGKIDAIIAGMSPTAERREIIDFSENYYTSDLVMVVKKDGAYASAKSLEDFKGAKVTGQLNTFHYGVIDQIEGVDKQVALDSFPTMITSLRAGKLDAYVSERPGALAATLANPDLSMVAFEEGKGFVADPEDTSIAVGIAKNSPLLDMVNDQLKGISEETRQKAMEQMIVFQAQMEELDSNEEAVKELEEPGFFKRVGAMWANYGSLFLRGAGITLLISFLGTAFGLLIGLCVQLVRSIPSDKRNGASKIMAKFFQLILNMYVELFRSTPMMVQSMLIYYGSKQFLGIDMNPLFAGIFIVSINTGAYLAETIRGGIESVDKGQYEAAHAIGLSHSQQMVNVILPQAMRAILPSIGNEFIVNIKDTSVLNVISVTELFFVTKGVAGSTYQIFQAYFIVAVIYLTLTRLASFLVAFMGRKINPDSQFTISSMTGA